MTAKAALRQAYAVVVLTVMVGVALPAFAHPDILLRIEAATKQIAASGEQADLLYRRGELHRLHDDYENAWKDYERARVLAPKNSSYFFYTGRAWLQRGAPKKAIAALDVYLSGDWRFAAAWQVRARAKREIGDMGGAVKDYGQAILHGRTSPDVYLARAQIQADIGAIDDALAGLQEGLATLGGVPALLRMGVGLEAARGQPDAALDWLERAPERLQQTPSWLVLRADILVQSGRRGKAVQAYEQARAAIDRLPAARRGVPRLRELRARIEAKLAEMK